MMDRNKYQKFGIFCAEIQYFEVSFLVISAGGLFLFQDSKFVEREGNISLQVPWGETIRDQRFSFEDDIDQDGGTCLCKGFAGDAGLIFDKINEV